METEDSSVREWVPEMIRYEVRFSDQLPTRYALKTRIVYRSLRYGKTIICESGMESDGATGATDLPTLGWWVHDQLCNTGEFSDGSKCNNWQASRILGDILRDEGRWIRSKSWFWATYLFGGGKARDNGMI